MSSRRPLRDLAARTRAQFSRDRSPWPDFQVQGTTVLVTGAASGMGLLHARRAAQDGAGTVILWDRSEDGLGRVRAELEAAHPSVAFRADVVDLSDARALAAAAGEVSAQTGVPDLLINNAGIVTGEYFWDHTEAAVTSTLAVNTQAPMLLTLAFLPSMIKRRTPARIVNVASASGLLPVPRMSVYAASKWAAVGWSDSLRLELEQAGHHQVRVLTVCPSYISTGMFEGARGPMLTPIMEPDYVVERIWDELADPRSILMLPSSVRSSALLKGVLPQRVFDSVVGRGMGVYRSMQDFTGRTGRGPDSTQR